MNKINLDDPITLRNLVNINQALEIVGVSRRTLYNWMNDGKLSFVRTRGGGRRIDKRDLFVYSEQNNERT